MNIPPLNFEQLKQFTASSQDVEWRYEMRRESQQIIPGLYLGPFQVSKDLNQLLTLGITHIVCMRDAKEAFSVKPRFPGHFKYMVLDVEDTEDQNLIRLFPDAKQFIYSAIESGGHVLVHCNGGISLSPAFVVMFVMEHFKLNFEEALHLVQSRRYCISPNGGFMTQIKEYESIYRAMQTVASFGPSRGEQNRRKREEEDDDDEAQRAEERKRAYLSEQDSNSMPSESQHSSMEF